MLRQNAVFFEWPFAGPAFGKPVRFYDPIGPFHLSMWGDRYNVKDIRKVNSKGGPDKGVWFDNLNDAIDHINNNI